MRRARLNFPGTTGTYETRGNSTSFDVNAGVYYEDYPTLNVAFGKSVSDFEVLGTDTTGSGDSRFFTTSSSYTLAGFDLAGRFNLSRIGNTLTVCLRFQRRESKRLSKGIHVFRQPQTARLDAVGNELLAESCRYRLRAQPHERDVSV